MVEEWISAALAEARVARLATAGADGVVRLVPICFALVGEAIVSAVDHKPKRTGQLRRLDDMVATGTATVLIDHYDDADWSRLWWIRIRGEATVLEVGDPAGERAIDALVAKYPQYRDRPPRGPAYRVTIDELRSWRGDVPPG